MVEKCCFGCCTVETGTAIIAILNIIGGILQIIKGSVVVSLMISHQVAVEQYPGFETYPAVYITFQFIGILMALVYTVVSGMLFQGYRTRNEKLCNPWLYWSYLYLGLTTIGTIVYLVVFALGSGLILDGLLFVFFAAIYLAIAVYLVLVVQRFVNEIKGGVSYDPVRLIP